MAAAKDDHNSPAALKAQRMANNGDPANRQRMLQYKREREEQRQQDIEAAKERERSFLQGLKQVKSRIPRDLLRVGVAGGSPAVDADAGGSAGSAAEVGELAHDPILFSPAPVAAAAAPLRSNRPSQIPAKPAAAVAAAAGPSNVDTPPAAPKPTLAQVKAQYRAAMAAQASSAAAVDIVVAAPPHVPVLGAQAEVEAKAADRHLAVAMEGAADEDGNQVAAPPNGRISPPPVMGMSFVIPHEAVENLDVRIEVLWKVWDFLGSCL